MLASTSSVLSSSPSTVEIAVLFFGQVEQACTVYAEMSCHAALAQLSDTRPCYPRLVKGKGAWVTSASGNKYLDFTSGIGVTNTGHCHPHVVKAIQDQVSSKVSINWKAATQLVFCGWEKKKNKKNRHNHITNADRLGYYTSHPFLPDRLIDRLQLCCTHSAVLRCTTRC